MTCEKCGRQTRRLIYVGTDSMCPGCRSALDSAHDAHGIITDDIPGGQVIENLGHEPMTFYSKKAILAEADKRGLRLRDQWAGPHDKYLSNWSAVISPDTLENARILLERVGQQKKEPKEDLTWHSWETHTRVGTLAELTK